MKLDSEKAAELFFVLGFESGLGRRQEGADGVVDEVELERGGWPAVAKRVELLQCFDAFFEGAAPALLLDILGLVARETGNDVHLVRTQEFRQFLHRRFKEDGQVAAVDDLAAEPARLLNEPAE